MADTGFNPWAVFVYWLSFANPAAVSAEVAQCAAWMSDLPVGVTHLTTALTTITATSQNAVGLDPLTTAINNSIALVRQSIT